MQVTLAGQLGAAQLVEHDLGRRRVDARQATVSHHVWLPPTLSAAPIVALEALDPESLVRGIVTTFDSRSASIIVNSLRGRPKIARVRFAARTATDSDAAAARFAAARLRKHRHIVTTS
jgi:hypothetical protein